MLGLGRSRWRESLFSGLGITCKYSFLQPPKRIAISSATQYRMYSFHLRPLLPTICVIYRRTTSPHHRLFLPSDLIVAESLVEFLASNGLTVGRKVSANQVDTQPKNVYCGYVQPTSKSEPPYWTLAAWSAPARK